MPNKRIWKEETSRKFRNVKDMRALLDEFASKNKFDPLVAEHWYAYNRKHFPVEVLILKNIISYDTKI